ncbi:MAG TPA: hypothetical protein VFF70_00575 [Anaerolineae bacterium]|jgi:uncharacterized protein (DUF934 family)|nr:hypothetical protein [Anaerolineae bacterium]
MAKKTRKVKQQESQQRAIRQAVNNTQSVSIAPMAGAAPVMVNRSAGVRAAPLEPGEEYKYVRSDLKRIALLALSFTVILIALSFVIK